MMSLNKTLLAFALGLAIAATASCSNQAEQAADIAARLESDSRANGIDSGSIVTCYSGGVMIVNQEVSNTVWVSSAGRIEYRNADGKIVRILADCIVVSK